MKKIIIDIGTGDGKLVLKNAIKNKQNFYIGIDPVKENFVKKKNMPENAMLLVGSLENLPKIEAEQKADEISVILPWGSLLEAIVLANTDLLKNIKSIAKSGASFEFVFSSENFDNLSLPKISKDYFGFDYKAKLRSAGLIVKTVEVLSNDEIKNYGSSWANKLAYGRKREFFRICGIIG